MTERPSKGPGGFFMLNTQRTIDLVKRIRCGETRWIFLFLSLRAWGWDSKRGHPGNGTVRASVSYIAEAVGVSRNSADKYLRELVENGLIRVQEKRRHGTVWSVAPLLARGGDGGDDERQLALDLLPPIAQNLGSAKKGLLKTWDADCSRLEQSIAQNLGTTVDIDIRSLSPSLSVWNEFTATLVGKQRERADRVLKTLRDKYPNDPVQEILECPENLKRFGAPDGDPVKSPLGLMESSWPQLRDFFRVKIAAERKRAAQAAREAAEREKAAAQDREWRERKQAFLDAFPDEQERLEAIRNYSRGSGADPAGIVAMTTAVGRWWATDRRGGPH